MMFSLQVPLVKRDVAFSESDRGKLANGLPVWLPAAEIRRKRHATREMRRAHATRDDRGGGDRPSRASQMPRDASRKSIFL
jgi:hypothetical protein